MKLISAARLRRAQESLNNAQPYSEALSRVADSVLGAQRASLAPAEGAANAALVVVVTSDRGLCGAYNTNILRFAEQHARDLSTRATQTRFFAVGRKTLEHLKRTRATIVGDSTGNSRLANIELARLIAHRGLSAYQSGEVREFGLVYAHFRSAVSQQPVYERLLPVAGPEGKEGQAEGVSAQGGIAASTDYLIEPSRAELIPLVIRTYVEAAIFHALAEAETSEHAARMTAMDAATSNAIDMIASLTLEMNRARQAMITRELMDIVGGAESLRG